MSSKASIQGEKRVMNVHTHSYSYFYFLFVFKSFYRLGSVFGPEMFWIALKTIGIFLGYEFWRSPFAFDHPRPFKSVPPPPPPTPGWGYARK